MAQFMVRIYGAAFAFATSCGTIGTEKTLGWPPTVQAILPGIHTKERGKANTHMHRFT